MTGQTQFLIAPMRRSSTRLCCTAAKPSFRTPSAAFSPTRRPPAFAAPWPLDSAVPPVSECRFAGDLHGLRDALAHDPVTASLDALRRGDLVFATNEAVTNVVKHGDGHATMRLWSDGDAVVSEVSCGSRIDDVMAGRRRPPADAAAGRGLWLVNQICDLVELRSGDGGTTVRMRVRAA